MFIFFNYSKISVHSVHNVATLRFHPQPILLGYVSSCLSTCSCLALACAKKGESDLALSDDRDPRDLSSTCIDSTGLNSSTPGRDGSRGWS